MANQVHIGLKNHNIPAYIDAALRLYINGQKDKMAPSNNDFLQVVDFLRAQNKRRSR